VPPLLGTARSWRGTVPYAPRTGGAYNSHHRTGNCWPHSAARQWRGRSRRALVELAKAKIADATDASTIAVSTCRRSVHPLARVESYGPGAANLPPPASCGFLRATVVLLQHCPDFYTAPHCRADCLVAYQRIPTNWGRVMTSSLLSCEQITAISPWKSRMQISIA
jgi:hypothetical protein